MPHSNQSYRGNPTLGPDVTGESGQSRVDPAEEWPQHIFSGWPCGVPLEVSVSVSDPRRSEPAWSVKAGGKGVNDPNSPLHPFLRGCPPDTGSLSEPYDTSAAARHHMTYWDLSENPTEGLFWCFSQSAHVLSSALQL
ncbi:hypothetical protein EYF80_030130 [Liparis tanakae]|uniref:Uncharacterized protein n=1 Tax=Liparis tanakae TaxID=230148 RepID=A0A4Z2H499_9TELE|nr:hypothetical protein EYF80_030130 [Liparis tanakae]